MKKILLLLAFLICGNFSTTAQVAKPEVIKENQKKSIHKNLNDWHKAAANANFENYFGLMTEDAVFIGTDATENWQLEEFKSFSRPYFEAGKAWSFEVLQRNIYLYENTKLAWFDELLSTQMGICRGSGVVSKEGKTWKVKHYVLSIAVPNKDVEELTKIKKDFDTNLIQELQNN